MIRPVLALLLLAPLLGSCQRPEIEVRAAFLDDVLVFVAADPGDADAEGCWTGLTIVDDSARRAWEFSAAHCDRLFPYRVGTPLSTDRLRRGLGLETGRLYIVTGETSGSASVSGAFALSRAGDRLIVHNVDPASPAARAVRSRFWQSGQAAAPVAAPAAAP